MADDLKTTEFTDIVSGWNERLSMGSAQISQMIPFVELYAIFRPEDGTSDVGNNDFQNQAIDVVIKEDDTDKTGQKVKIAPLFNLLTQQTTQDPKNPQRMFSHRGPAGIESAQVRYQNIELSSYMITCDISIPSIEHEVTTNAAFRKLLTQNTEWLFVYGWSKGGTVGKGLTLPKFLSANKEIVLARTNKGYFRVLRTLLIRYDFEVDGNKMVTGKIQFMSNLMNGTTFVTAGRGRQDISNLLNMSVSGSKLIARSTQEKSVLIGGQPKRFKSSTTLMVQEDQGETKAKIPGYYYLGWILEAIRQSLELDPDKIKWWNTTLYQKFVSTKTVSVQQNIQSQVSPIDVVCESPADIPIHIGWFNTLINNTLDSLFALIPQILGKAGEVLISSISCTVDKTGKKLEVMDYNDAAFASAKTKSTNQSSDQPVGMYIVLSAQNSLLENVSFSSAIPKELTYGLDVLIKSDNGAANLQNLAEKCYKREVVEQKLPPERQSALTKIYIDYQKQTTSKNVQDSKATPEWKQYIRSSKIDKEKVYNQILSTNEVPVGFALRYFFNNLQLKIHGTAGVPPFQPVTFRGFLKGIDGIYIVYQSSDSISIGDFTTTLDCKLIEPFGDFMKK